MIYRRITGHDPDPANRRAAQALLARGGTLAEVQRLAAHSRAAADRIETVYHALLAKPVDAASLAQWQNYLATTSGSWHGLIPEIAHGHEEAREIAGLYQQALDRPPTASELNADEAVLSQTVRLMSLQVIRALIAALPEMSTSLNRLYQADLGRDATAAELARYRQAVSNGSGSFQRVQATLPYTNAVKTALTSLDEQMTGQDPSPDQLHADQQALAAGSSLAAIKASLLASPALQQELAGIYQAATGTAANAATLAGLTDQLRTSGTIDAVYTIIADDPQEVQRLGAVYQQATGTAASATVLSNMSSFIASGGSLSEASFFAGAPGLATPFFSQPLTGQNPEGLYYYSGRDIGDPYSYLIPHHIVYPSPSDPNYADDFDAAIGNLLPWMDRFTAKKIADFSYPDQAHFHFYAISMMIGWYNNSQPLPGGGETFGNNDGKGQGVLEVTNYLEQNPAPGVQLTVEQMKLQNSVSDPEQSMLKGSVNIDGYLGQPIENFFDKDNLAVINTTEPKHIFAKGLVVQEVVSQYYGELYIDTVGLGNNSNFFIGALNVAAGIGGFIEADEEAAVALSKSDPGRFYLQIHMPTFNFY